MLVACLGALTQNVGMAETRPGTDPASIGKRIVQTREAMGLKPSDFARLLGFSTSALANYETGARRPNIDQAFVIVRQTGVTLDWIYLGDMSGLPHRLASKLQEAEAMRRRA